MGRFTFAELDMASKLGSKPYAKKLEKLQEELRVIQQAYLFTKDAAVIVFEGWDAAGKGGTIRRITSVLDPRGFNVWPIGAPRSYYKERHYMARFWDKLPPKGAIGIFDRSWYGRVLVERVEKFATEVEVQNAYQEINNFEQTLMDNGIRVLKFFLYITPEEQLQRFEKRLLDPVKRWKLGYEDFRNRKRWDEYELAAEDMFEKTSTDDAPWNVIPANNKKYARIEIITKICQELTKGVDLSPQPIDERVLEEAEALFDLQPGLVETLVGRRE